MKNIFENLKQFAKAHRSSIILALCITALFVSCILIIRNSMRKNITMEAALKKIEEKEKEVKKILEEKALLVGILKIHDKTINNLTVQDIELQRRVSLLDHSVLNLTNQYHVKADSINHYSSAQLLQYFSDL